MLFKAFNINVLRNFESSQHFLNGSVLIVSCLTAILSQLNTVKTNITLKEHKSYVSFGCQANT